MHIGGDPRVHDRMHDIGAPTHLTRPSDPNKPRFAYDRSGFRFSSGAQSCLTSEGQGGALSSSLPTSCRHVHGSRCAFANDNVMDNISGPLKFAIVRLFAIIWAVCQIREVNPSRSTLKPAKSICKQSTSQLRKTQRYQGTIANFESQAVVSSVPTKAALLSLPLSLNRD